MKKEIERNTNIIFGHLIQQLYGQNDFYRIRKKHSISKLRKYYIKIINTFSISINETISIADKTQFELLNSIISDGINRLRLAKSFDFLDNTFIEIQTKLIFQLIGNVPNRWSQKNVPNRKEFWRLNIHRQIQYVQDPNQKEKLIFSLLQSKYSERFPNFLDFIERIYWTECNYDFNVFLNWIKMNHSDIYQDLI